MKASWRKTKNGYVIKGDLSDCIEVAESKLLILQQELPYISRRFLEEKRRYDTIKKSIEDCRLFIASAKNELKRRIFEENENKGQGTENERSN